MLSGRLDLLADSRGLGMHLVGELALPGGELLADGGRGRAIEAVCGELFVGVVLDAGEGGLILVETGLGLVLCGEFEQSSAGVAGLQERVDVDGVPDFGAAEESAGLGGGEIVEVEDRTEVRCDGRVVEQVADQLHLRLGAGGGIRDVQARVHLCLLSDLDEVPGRLVRLDEACDRLWQLPLGASDRGEQVDIVTDAADEAMSLDGVSAREPVAEVLGERFQADADEPMVQFFHYAAAADALASSGKRYSHAALAGRGRNSACQWLRSTSASRCACRSSGV